MGPTAPYASTNEIPELQPSKENCELHAILAIGPCVFARMPLFFVTPASSRRN